MHAWQWFPLPSARVKWALSSVLHWKCNENPWPKKYKNMAHLVFPVDFHQTLAKQLQDDRWLLALLRIPDSYDAKIVKICNLWTFWPVIQLISSLFKKGFCRILKRWFISWITDQNVQKLQIFAILASQLSGILKAIKDKTWVTWVSKVMISLLPSNHLSHKQALHIFWKCLPMYSFWNLAWSRLQSLLKQF